MNPIGLKKKICMFVDRLLKIDRRAEYGLMDKQLTLLQIQSFLTRKICIWRNIQVFQAGQ